MNKILTTALRKLPKTTKKTEIRFLWRIILEKFDQHEEEIIDYLNEELGELDKNRDQGACEHCHERYKVLLSMRELTCHTSLRLWQKLKGVSICESLDMEMISLVNDKFDKLSLPEQLSIIELALADTTSESDCDFLGCRLAATQTTPATASIIEHLKKRSGFSKQEVEAFLLVIKLMSAG